MQKTILIVEDDTELRDFLKKILAQNNFKVAEASDGAEALEAVEKYFPDLVLLDFGLPKVSGETVCVKIKKDHPEIIVIALTEKNKSSDVVHGLQIGADDYIGKPFVAEELIARIDARLKTPENGQLQPNQPNQEELESNKITFRESLALISIRLILTEALFGLFFFLFSILIYFIGSYSATTDFFTLYFIILVGGLLINVGILFFVALKWIYEYTEVTKEGIIKHSGILYKKQKKICL